MKVFKTFLESSTIHGLGYISTSKSGVEKLAWASFVLTGFSLAAYLILTSYIDMQDSPVSTSISTHPTSSLEQSCKKQNEATIGLKSRDPTYFWKTKTHVVFPWNFHYVSTDQTFQTYAEIIEDMLL